MKENPGQILMVWTHPLLDGEQVEQGKIPKVKEDTLKSRPQNKKD